MACVQEQFAQEIISIRNKYQKKVSTNDILFLKKIIWVNRLFMLIGLALAPMGINVFSILLITLSLTANWTIRAHHVLHGAYDNIVPKTSSFHSNGFAKGWRWLIHWNDWLPIEGWKYEHNILHHFHTNESQDPDRVDLAVKLFKSKPILHIVTFVLFIFLWKPLYYSLSCYKALDEKKRFKHTTKLKNYLTPAIVKCYIPYVMINFIMLPLCFFPFGWLAVKFVFINRFIAELLTNIHSALIIIPNHSGDDLATFEDHFKDKADFFKRQIISSCNFRSPNIITDYLYGFLNFQIEHHLYPKIPPNHYRAISKEIQAACQKYNIKTTSY